MSRGTTGMIGHHSPQGAGLRRDNETGFGIPALPARRAGPVQVR